MQSPAWHAETGDAPRALTIPATAAHRPPVVPAVVLVECLSGRQRADAVVNRFLKKCKVLDAPDEKLARRAGSLRARAGRGSAVDAVVVAMAEPGGAVLTHDIEDLRALAAHARDVTVFAA